MLEHLISLFFKDWEYFKTLLDFFKGFYTERSSNEIKTLLEEGAKKGKLEEKVENCGKTLKKTKNFVLITRN